ncbi:MAG TPA: malto-oligosyltrehalose synthase [Candidatus Acidoferrum sp.]|nr:malto-oligosyltrehalose synthase [Candidatus Acidoferrum sp.]
MAGILLAAPSGVVLNPETNRTARTHPPRATYRVQFHRGFTFDDAVNVAGYLADLGISHLYSSPYLQAVPGSTHGYDVIDHGRVNEELGGAEGHTRLCFTLARHGLGQILDVVPNHMAIAARGNAWWWDVLENGPSSRYASYFDVDWDPPESRLRNTVLLPVLGEHYGRALEAGAFRLHREGAAFSLTYHEHAFPVSPPSLDEPLGTAAMRVRSDTLAFIADALGHLPLSTATDWLSVQQRHRDKEVLRQLLERLLREEPEVAAAVTRVVDEINASPDALDALLEQQNYRLAFWRTAGRDLGYRRFFDINSLVGLRTEEDRVFTDTHALVLRWLGDGMLDGLRIDHPDGLRDPEHYLRRLHNATPTAWTVVEKILEPGERLRESWVVAGTTGYDFLNRVGGLFVDPDGEKALTGFYADFTGEPTDFAAVARQKKHLVMREVLGSDVNRLTALFLTVCERHRRHRDYTRHELHEVLREVIAWFPVYRTYMRASNGEIHEDDARYVGEAIEAAKAARPDLDAELFDFFRDLLLLRLPGSDENELVMRFQQLTGPVMAKGVEDTAFYNFNRLVALNEVGGDPGRFGVSVEEFHRESAEAQARWPRTMLATSTHDTKRGEDVRARLALLSEIPERWSAAVQRWGAINESHRRGEWPDRNAEYLLYQTLVGAWPIQTDRVIAYMQKAAREAKAHTSWTDPRAAYEDALRGFITDLLADRRFVADLEAFVAPLVEPGRINSLAQTLVKLTAPGVPDLYQGTELWTLTLVDPDNRAPVDYALRRRLLDELDDASPEDVWRRIDEGLPKLWTIRQTLGLRRRRPELFGAQGDYRSLEARGARARHAVVFMRGDAAITVAPRFVIGLGGDWGDTVLEVPDGRWRNELTGDVVSGGAIRLGDLLRRFPVALLAREEPAV